METKSVFNHKDQIDSIYVDYLKSTYLKPNKPKSPNSSRELTTEDFEKSVEALAEPFAKAVRDIYNDRN